MNEFDLIMAKLVEANVVAFVRNCNVGSLGGIPATFQYGYSAALQWAKGPHMSRRETTTAEGDTPTAALLAAIEKAGLQLLPSDPEERRKMLAGQTEAP